MAEDNVVHNGYVIRATSTWDFEVLDDKGKVVHRTGGYRSVERAVAAGRVVINQALPKLETER